MKIEMIGFDADDTLWHTDIHYQQTLEAIKTMLNPWETAERIDTILDEVIIANLPWYGYGIKALILSLIEAAIRISGGEINGNQVRQILSLGKTMLSAEVVLRPHVSDTLRELAKTFPLMIITKGDLLDQTTKIERSGLAGFFSTVEIVHDKTSAAYASLLEKNQINPPNFLMVGNSIRSDIEPVLALGGRAVHIPADSTWEHEIVPGFDTTQEGFFELEHMGQLTDLIARISDGHR
jgi:putative hydrolase of the HAD superfamily